jgi:hypothetical protein
MTGILCQLANYKGAGPESRTSVHKDREDARSPSGVCIVATASRGRQESGSSAAHEFLDGAAGKDDISRRS